ncbi:MAG: 16S rRNA (cytosine(967)-C(5))-methyltransferase RsmB [candidate division WOR-3 bacterium]|jgi:16S rRNA (cytosine967-C5)-methyltransferase
MNGRELALKALIEFESGGKTLKNMPETRKGKKADRDIQKAYDYFYGTVKMIKRLDFILDEHLKKKRLENLPLPIRNVLREGAYGLLFSQDPDHAVVNESVNLAKKYGHNGTASLVNAVLRNLHTVVYPEEKVEYLSVFYSFPEFLVGKLIEAYGEKTENILKESNKPPVTTIRVNRLKATPERVLEDLKKEGFKAETIETIEYNLLTESGVVYSESFKGGDFQIQGVTQTMNAEMLSPKRGEIILDLCSVPGTKSTAIAEIMGDEGIILSVDRKKLHQVVRDAKRLRIKNIYPVRADVRDFRVKKADRILLDVPCSGTGVMGKRGDLRWNVTPESLGRLVNLQREMLISAAENLVKSGVLVYSTCSILPEENEEQVEWFVNENQDFIVERVSLNLPGQPFYDGGFGAVLIRR